MTGRNSGIRSIGERTHSPATPTASLARRGTRGAPRRGRTVVAQSGRTLDTVRDLIARATDGELLLLDAHGRDELSEGRLREQYTAAREAEWVEFVRDCAKFHAELKREVAKKKFTLAELEEEEQSLDR